MSYREHPPHPALGPYVDRLWTRAACGTGGAPVRVLPDGCIDVLVDLERAEASVVGTMTGPLVLPAGPRAGLAAVRFRPGGAAPFLGLPVHELTDRRVAAAALGSAWLAEAARAVAARADRAIDALEGVLLARVARLPARAPADRLVAQAVRRLFEPAAPSVAALAAGLGVTRQHLGRVFRARVGVGPKELARVARVQRALALVQADAAPSFAATAAELGYADEAHMDRDFRLLVGITPGAVRRARGSILPIHSLLAGA